MSGRYALVVGNTDYSDPGLARLTAPGKDAKDFARVLQSKDICAFDDVQVLLNQPEPIVREAIEAFFDDKRPDDLLVLYFSGHGVRDEYGSLYLAVKNTNRLRLRATAIKSDFIRESMDQSRSRRQVLILDCCNSGAFAQGTKAATGVSIGTASAFEGTGYGRVVLTASDSTQFAWEGDRVVGTTENSLFTHFLIDGLEGEADQDGDGRITIDELYDYAYEQIVNVTPKQTPGKWSYKQQGEIVMRQSTRLEDIRPMALPDDLQEEIRDTRPYVREAAVQKLALILQGKNIGLMRSAQEALEQIASDEDSTRRVALAATQALEAFRAASQSSTPDDRAKAAPIPSKIKQEERKPSLTGPLAQARAAAGRLNRHEERPVPGRVPSQAAGRLPWRTIGMAGIVIAAVAALGYAGTRFLLPILMPEPTPTARPRMPGVGDPVRLSTDGSVYGVAFSPDGNTLASAGGDTHVTLWNVRTHKFIGGPMLAHTDAVTSVAFSPNGSMLASGSADKTIILWNVETRLPIGSPLEGHTDGVNAVAFSPDGKVLASASSDATVRLWDVETRQPIGAPLQWHTGPVYTVAFSPDGKYLASAGEDKTIILWDAATRQPVGQPMRKHTGEVYRVAFSPDGTRLASGAGDNTVILWDVQTQEPIGEPLQEHSNSVTSLSFSPDGKTLASGSYDGTVVLWDTEKRQPLGPALAEGTSLVHGVAFGPDGTTLAEATADNVIALWDLSKVLHPAASPTPPLTPTPQGLP